MKKITMILGPVVPALMLLLVYVGDRFAYSVVSFLIFTGLMSVLTVLSVRYAPLQPASDDPPPRHFATGNEAWWIRGAGLLGLGLLFLLFSERRYQGMIIFPQGTVGLYAAVSAATACLVLLVVKPPKPAISLIVLIAAGLAVRTLWFSVWEINPAKRDMLALVISAIETFLSGDNPYAFHQMQRGSEVPLTYPPGLWLMHLPAYLSGLDIRWTAWLSDLVIAGCLGGYAVWRRSAFLGPVFVGLAAYLFLPDIHWNGIYAEPHADWAILALILFSALIRRPLLTGALFGVALTTRPFNLVLLPFFAIWLFRELGTRRAVRAFLVTGAIAAMFYLPFVLWDPDAFYAGTVRWLLAYGPAHRTWFHTKMGFSGFLYLRHLEYLMAPAQLATLLIASGLAVWKLKNTRHLLAFWMFAYALFVAFNSIVWMSFWIGVCLTAIALLAAAGVTETATSPEPRAPHSSKYKYVTLSAESALAAGIVVALSVMLFLLHRHFDDDNGLEQVHVYLDATLAPGDFVVDDAGYRKAILQTPYVLSKEDLPNRAALGTTPFQTQLPRRRFAESLSRPRVFAVERFGLFDAARTVYLGPNGSDDGPFVEAETKQFGNYTVHRLDQKSGGFPNRRLSEDPARLTVIGVSDTGSRTGLFGNNRWFFGRGAASARIGIETCRIDNSSAEMLALSPRDTVTYEISTPAKGEWVTIFGGMPDRTAAWHRAPAALTVQTGDERIIGTYLFPNLSGMRGTTFKLPKGTRTIQFLLTTHQNPNPTFCFDALF